MTKFVRRVKLKMFPGSCSLGYSYFWISISYLIILFQRTVGTGISDREFEAAFQGHCADEKNPCDQTCFDLHDGTFECGCRESFTLQPNGYSCRFNSDGSIYDVHSAAAMTVPETTLSATFQSTPPTSPSPTLDEPDTRPTTPIYDKHAATARKQLIYNGGYLNDEVRVKLSANANESTDEGEAGSSDRLLRSKCTELGLCENGGLCGKWLGDDDSEMFFGRTDDDMSGVVAVKCLCPLGKTGQHCKQDVDIKYPRFSGTSYQMFLPLRIVHREMQISIEFRPESRNGLLLFSRDNASEFDEYYMVALVNGFVQFRFEGGWGSGTIKSAEPVTLDAWNRVAIYRRRWDAWMRLNNGKQVIGRTQGLFSRRSFHTNVFLGGISRLAEVKPVHSVVRQGFFGCVRHLEIDAHSYDLRSNPRGEAHEGLDIGECSSDLCSKVTCEHGGKCVAISPDAAICLCPLGYVGDYCEKVVSLIMPLFNGTSYLKYPALGSRFLSYLEISVTFKPTNFDGLILFDAGSRHANGDFFSLALSNGYVEFRFDLGNGPAIIRNSQLLSLHQWHTVMISRTGRLGLLQVDDQEVVQAVSPGAFTQLLLGQHMYVGGVPDEDLDTMTKLTEMKELFKGCIQQVAINGHRLHLFEAALVGVNVANCDHPCVNQPCQHDGSCFPHGDHYTCSCNLGFAGSRCHTELTGNITVPMFIGNSYFKYSSESVMQRILGDKTMLSFRLRTTAPNGLLLWTGRKAVSASSDFLSLSIQHGFVYLRYNLGSGETTIRHNATKVDDGEWHRVNIARYGQESTLMVDYGPVFMGATPGSLSQLNTDNGLYLGGMPDMEQFSFGRHSIGFVGCMSDFILSGTDKINMVTSAVSGLNIETCV